jgi:D-alanyl-lipoteichoic acid acyltransferase DltB (MBOAT superfamily)
MLTMVIGGLWHGAAWTFVVWGAIHGVALVAERRWQKHRVAVGAVDQPWTSVVRWIITFHVVCLAWIFFRAENFSQAWAMLSGLVTDWGLGHLVKPMVVFTIVAMVAAQFVPTRLVEAAQVAFSRAAPVAQGALLALGFLVIDALGPAGVAPFIYFQF